MRNCRFFKVLDDGTLKCLSDKPCRLYSYRSLDEFRYGIKDKQPSWKVCHPHKRKYRKPFIEIQLRLI